MGEELTDESGRTTVKLIYRPPIARDSDDEDEDEDDDESDPSKDLSVTVLCSLTPGKACIHALNLLPIVTCPLL